MIKVLLSGCFGRMGKTIVEASLESDKIEIISGVDILDGESRFPVYKSIDECIEVPDVIIDFSHHTSLPAIMKYAVKNKIGRAHV